MWCIRALGSLSLVVAVASCATIMHGTNQDLGVSSTPTNARVVVDGRPLGVTPTVAKLKRGSSHVIHIELDGYQPFDATVTKKVSGWVWGNIVFGGLIGLVVDAASGGLYNLTPEQVTAQLARSSSSAKASPDGIYVFLVKQPDPGWQFIGLLRH